MNLNPTPRTGVSAGEVLRSLVGTENVQQAGPQESVGGKRVQWLVAPATETEVASVLRFANDSKLAVIPRGGGTKLSWGNRPRAADIVLSLARLNAVIEHVWQDLTVTVEAGCTFAKLQAALGRHGQRLALDPLWPEHATIGGILSANDTGTLRLFYGGLRDLLIGATLVLADGTVARSGGKVVKNVAGYDLPKLTTGALGTLGIITRAVFRVHPLPAKSRCHSLLVQSPEEAQQLILQLLDAKLSLTALQVRFASEGPAFLDIGLEGTPAGLSAQEHLLESLLQPRSLQSGPAGIWKARQNLWSENSTDAVAKVSVLPASIGKTLQLLEGLAHSLAWQAVVQATGISWIRLNPGTGVAAEREAAAVLEELRSVIEREGGSLVFLRAGSGFREVDAWGRAGDALPLMRALKQQFDPNGTLNPGRYVGGI